MVQVWRGHSRLLPLTLVLHLPCVWSGHSRPLPLPSVLHLPRVWSGHSCPLPLTLVLPLGGAAVTTAAVTALF
jgi:hypothetical protein